MLEPPWFVVQVTTKVAQMFVAFAMLGISVRHNPTERHALLELTLLEALRRVVLVQMVTVAQIPPLIQ